ncbi:polymorphic toxin-type HINT domain-containing protein [Paractinoplanes brasiliensis]|uniref:polymorphic toxin-type HINT domain-containing protein n=1 Tax=Paractinoplanes brasiliensis TaxID=52695 RepID=UPI001061A88C|nr:polymorphic toxin-type HINT domain-containing protein [Actinoplanes brasiliensis]GID29944.1 hypothetical protein Abr02nite_49270 [Actinoplanes brasiliensis]
MYIALSDSRIRSDNVGRAKKGTGKKKNHGYNHKNHVSKNTYVSTSEAKGTATVVPDEYSQPRLVCFSGFFCIEATQITNVDAYVASYNAAVAQLSEGTAGQTLEDYQYAGAMLSACMAGEWELTNCGSPMYNILRDNADQSAIAAADRSNHDVVNSVIAASLATLEYVAGKPRCVLRGGGVRKSFSGDTPVLMADGSHKLIKNVRAGDLVLATDPQTGEQGPREVTATWVHPDDLFTLTIGDSRKITTTEDHLFWNVTDQRWERADDLDRGDILLSPDGSGTAVTAFSDHARHVASAYTLTIDGIHTYYVVASGTAVLVHNAPRPDPFGLPSAPGVYIITLDTGEKYVGQGKNIAERWRQHFSPRGTLKKAGFTRDNVTNVEYRLPAQGVSLNQLESEVFDEFGGKSKLPYNTNNPTMYKIYGSGPGGGKYAGGTCG